MTALDRTRERRAELLAVAAADDLLATADRLLAEGPELRVVAGPESGMVVLQVREPVAEHRFHLGEVLVTSAEVVLDGHRGWAMRLGDDPPAALAAALLDAAAERGGEWRSAVDAVCGRAEAAARARADREWTELAPTEVRFEELDT